MKKYLVILVILGALLGLVIALQSRQISQSQTASNTSKLAPGQSYKARGYNPVELNSILTGEDKDKYVVIDVRTKQEYDKGHLPGAVHADYYDTEALKKAAGDKIPIAYCAFSAMRGPYAAYQLYQAGYTNVSVLNGGISAWAEDIQGMDSKDPKVKTVFNHPKNIFPEREKGTYPEGMGEVEFSINASQFAFTPNKMVVKHGQKVTLNMMSLDVTHGFALPEFGIEVELLPREPVTVSFIADRKGNFPFVCNVICGHDHPSMVGNLIVQ